MSDLDELRAIVDHERDPELWLEAAMAYVAALAADMETEAVDDMIVEIERRLDGDPARAIPAARRLAAVLSSEALDAQAIAQLERVIPMARDDAEQVELLLELVRLLRVDGREAEADARLASAEQIALARRPHDDVTARVHLVLAGTDVESRARAALHCAGDLALRQEATHLLGSVLFDRGELADAEQLVTALPALDTPTRALHEHILRRQGRLADEPPADELVVISPLTPGLSDEVIEFFTPPGDGASWTRSHPAGSADKIRYWSYGQVTCEADLESQRIFGPVRSLFCECGRYRGNRYEGVVCERCGVEVIDRATRASRLGHLRLAHPVLHPWFVPAVALLTGETATKLRALPGPDAVALLANLDLYEVELDLENQLRGASESKQRRLAPLGDLIAGLRARSYLRVEDLTLELVPVLGPEVELPGIDIARVRLAYRRLLVEEDPRAAVRALFACFSERAGAGSRG